MGFSVFYPPGSSAADPAEGTPGLVAPTTAIQIAGTDGTNLQVPHVSPAGLLSVDGSGSVQPVSGTVAATQSGAWNITNVTGTVSLPTGASTSALQTTGNTSLASIDTKVPALGAAAPTASVPVTLPLDVSPATINITTQDLVSASTTVYNSQTWYTGTPTAGSAAVFSLASVADGVINVTGTWTGTLQAEVTVDGTNWVAHGVHIFGSPNFVTTFTGNVMASINLAGKTQFRIRATAAMTGSATVKFVSSVNPATVYVANAIKLQDASSPTSSVQGTIKAASTAPVATDTALVVAISPNTGSLPLPTGAATSALQTSGNTTLTAISGQLPSALGAKTTANSLAVNIASDQTVPVSGTVTVASTTANQGTAAATASAWPIKVTDGTNVAAVKAASTAPVATDPAIVVAISPTTAGQTAAASSQPVTLSNENVQDLYVTGQSAQTATVNNILTVTAGTNATDLTGYRSASVQVVSTGTAGTYIFEGSNDNVNFISLTVYNAAVITGTPITGAITASVSNLVYTFPVVTRYARLRIATTVTGGSVQAFTKASQTAFAPAVMQVAQTTAANLAVTAATVTTVTNTTNNGTTYTNADIASAAIITTTTGGAVTVANGTSVAFNIAITVVSGTLPTYDFSVQESGDGTNWTTIYGAPRFITTGFFTTASIKLNHNRYRVVETISGTTPSFTRAITSSRTAGSNVMERCLVDRTLAPATGGSTSATLTVDGCTAYGLIALLGTGGTGNIQIALDGSDDGANWVQGLTFVNVVAAQSSPVQCAYSGTRFRFIRARVATAQTSSTLSYLTLFGTQDTLQSLPGRRVVTQYTVASSSLSTTYTQVIASTIADIHQVETFDSSGFAFIIGVGAAASEITQVYVFPGGNGIQPLFIPAGSRIAIKTTAGTPTSGTLYLNAYGV